MYMWIQISICLLRHICGLYVYVEAANSVLACVIREFMMMLISITFENNPNLAVNSVATEVLLFNKNLEFLL